MVVAAALEAAAADPRLEPWPDPHNEDERFARVRVRRSVLPLLEDALGPGIIDALVRTATLAREDADALDAWADRVWAAAAPVGLPTAVGRPAPAGLATPAGLHTGQQLGNEVLQEEQHRPELSARARDARGGRRRLLPVAALGADREPLPAAVVHRVVRRFLVEAGCPAGSLTAGHIRAVAALLDPGAPARSEVALPGARRARREADAVVVRV